MADRALMERTLQFLRDACNEWELIASEAAIDGNVDLERRARVQHGRCEEAATRLQTALSQKP